ncbi:MAG: isochorismatase family protein [Spirochaetes bacterium]|nr:isochorismatase family protein [Spirochaetota bacterium]
MGIDNYSFKRDDAALLIIDIQDRLFAAMDQASREMVEKNCVILIETAKIFGIPIVVSEQYRKGLGATIPSIAERLGGAAVHEKLSFDCYGEEKLCNALNGLDRQTVLITGIETHVCVLQTALSLLKAGKNAVVVGDAVASRRAYDREAALRALEWAGAIVYPAETVSFMLMERAGTPEFKKLSPMFK